MCLQRCDKVVFRLIEIAQPFHRDRQIVLPKHVGRIKRRQLFPDRKRRLIGQKRGFAFAAQMVDIPDIFEGYRQIALAQRVVGVKGCQFLADDKCIPIGGKPAFVIKITDKHVAQPFIADRQATADIVIVRKFGKQFFGHLLRDRIGGLRPVTVAHCHQDIADTPLRERIVAPVIRIGRVKRQQCLVQGKGFAKRLQRADKIVAGIADLAQLLARCLTVAHQDGIVRPLVGLPLRKLQRAGIGGLGLVQIALLLQHVADAGQRPDQLVNPVEIGRIGFDLRLREMTAADEGIQRQLRVAGHQLQIAQIFQRAHVDELGFAVQKAGFHFGVKRGDLGQVGDGKVIAQVGARGVGVQKMGRCF